MVASTDDQLWVIYLVCIATYVTTPRNTLNLLSNQKHFFHHGSKSIHSLQDHKILCKKKKSFVCKSFLFFQSHYLQFLMAN